MNQQLKSAFLAALFSQEMHLSWRDYQNNGTSEHKLRFMLEQRWLRLARVLLRYIGQTRLSCAKEL